MRVNGKMTIKIKSGENPPTKNDLADKQLGFCETDKDLYIRDGNNIIDINKRVGGYSSANEFAFKHNLVWCANFGERGPTYLNKVLSEGKCIRIRSNQNIMMADGTIQWTTSSPQTLLVNSALGPHYTGTAIISFKTNNGAQAVASYITPWANSGIHFYFDGNTLYLKNSESDSPRTFFICNIMSLEFSRDSIMIVDAPDVEWKEPVPFPSKNILLEDHSVPFDERQRSSFVTKEDLLSVLAQYVNGGAETP
jgi:hypothetical protein